MASQFFNVFVNLDKYLEHEQRDPFAAKVSRTGSWLWLSSAAYAVRCDMEDTYPAGVQHVCLVY